jgi:aminoglycoside phosphotransferase (APT) family kinase protein
VAHPPAEVTLTVEDVDRLVAAQHPTLRGPLELVAHGWDNDVFRLGDDLAVRLPRRQVAAALIENEQRWLPEMAERMPVPVPAPVALGAPGDDYPWAWSIVPWFAGRSAMESDAASRGAIAEQLADALLALHTPAPADAPANSYRGVPLAERDEVVRERLAPHPSLLAVWDAALAAPAWHGPKLWLHGDVHPGNVLIDDGRMSALIDFGDLTSGDPANDLSAAWLFFTTSGRERFRARLGDRYDTATWERARGWAAAFAGIALETPEHGFDALGAHALRELTSR